MTFHFKSIDAWLEGVCKSYCQEHAWRDDRDLWVPDKFSVFASSAEAEEYDEDDKENVSETGNV